MDVAPSAISGIGWDLRAEVFLWAPEHGKRWCATVPARGQGEKKPGHSGSHLWEWGLGAESGHGGSANLFLPLAPSSPLSGQMSAAPKCNMPFFFCNWTAEWNYIGVLGWEYSAIVLFRLDNAAACLQAIQLRLCATIWEKFPDRPILTTEEYFYPKFS